MQHLTHLIIIIIIVMSGGAFHEINNTLVSGYIEIEMLLICTSS